jgi:recombination protein RecT
MTTEIQNSNTQVPAKSTRPRTVADILINDDNFKRSLATALPKHLTADRMTRVCLTALRREPKLLQTKPESLMAAIMVCSQLGLEPNDPRQLAYLIPYKDETQLIIGYRGYIELAMRSGMVTSIQAMTVFEKDEFEYEQGLELKLRHVPYMGLEEPGKITCAYAIATMSNGSKAMVVVPRRDIERARLANPAVKAGRKSAWDEWYPEMAMKTAVRRLAKFMPQSPEFARAVEADEARSLRIDPSTFDPESVDMEPATTILAEAVDPKQVSEEQSENLGDRLAGKAAASNGGGKPEPVKTDMHPVEGKSKSDPKPKGQSRFGEES